MQDSLVVKAKSALLDNEKKEWAIGTSRPMTEKERDFLFDYFNTGRAGASYQKIFGIQNKGSANVMAHRLIKSLGVRYEEILDLHGHSLADLLNVLSRLKKDNPSDYVKYMLKLHRLETPETQVNINMIPPTINILNNELLYTNQDSESISEQ